MERQALIDLIKAVNGSNMSKSDRLEVVSILSAFSQMRTAILFADVVLNKRYTPFASTDQNPKGVRDLIGSAALLSERLISNIAGPETWADNRTPK